MSGLILPPVIIAWHFQQKIWLVIRYPKKNSITNMVRRSRGGRTNSAIWLFVTLSVSIAKMVACSHICVYISKCRSRARKVHVLPAHLGCSRAPKQSEPSDATWPVQIDHNFYWIYTSRSDFTMNWAQPVRARGGFRCTCTVHRHSFCSGQIWIRD